MGNGTKSGSMLMRALRGSGWLLLGLAVAASALPAAAQTPSQPIYGPVSVKLPSSKPFSFADSFSVPPSATGPYLVRVQLSAPNSLKTLSLTLNNVQVLSIADFAGGNTLVERTVNVLAKNTYSVQISGNAGTVITVTVFATPNLPKPTSLAPNPLTITAGATGTLTATLSPTPTAAGTLNVTSGNTAVATVPASVSFASGQTTVPIPVTTVATGSAIVTASANGGSASATVNVTPAPPTVTSLTPATLSLTQGANGTLTVTISTAQSTATQVVLATSDSGVAFVNGNVTVPAGAVSAPVAVTAVTPGTAQVTASLNGSSASSQVTVTAAPASVVSLVPVVARIAVGGNTRLVLLLSSAQPADTTVSLAVSPTGVVTVPASITVPAGQTTALVPVTSLALGQADITAMLGASSASAAVDVVPPPAQVMAVEPPTHAMTVGATSAFTVRINAAQLANTQIVLAVDDPSVLQIPASVTVAQGATSAVFTATALATGDAVVTVSVENTQKMATVQVVNQAAAIVSLVPSPLPLQQGAVGALTVTINAAQAADTSIAVANSAPAIVQVPATVTLPAGTTSTTVTVTALAAGNAQITASVNSTTATAAIQVAAPLPIVSAVTPATLTLPKGTPGTLRVTVSRAPNVATAVSLASSSPSLASVPATVNIPAGALFADFPVAANSPGQATISASLNGGTASAVVTITPAELVTLTLSPAPVSAYIGETVAFTATGTMTDGTSQSFTTSVTWTSSNTSVATITSTGLASALAAGQTTITAEFSFTAAQTGQTVTITAATILTVKQQVNLVLSAPVLTLEVAQSATVTVTSSDPAPSGGLVVTLTQSGAGSAIFPASVTIPASGTSTTFTLTGAATGQVTVTATATNRLPGSITFTIQPQLAITAISPTSGTVGTMVTLTGSGFDPVPASNQLAFRGINNTTVPAATLTATATQITVRVPALAETGPITLTNSRGTVQSPGDFTVTREQDFQLVVSPASLEVFQGASTTAQAQLGSAGSRQFTGLVTLSAQGLPAGVTVSFGPAATLSAFQTGAITFGAAAAAAPGTYSVTVTAEMKEAGAAFARSASVGLTVQSSANVTGVKGRFITPEGQGIGGVIARADIPGGSQPQTTTDAAGNFVLTGLPAGPVTLRFDARPVNPQFPVWPQTVTLTANQILLMEDWAIAPPPPAERFTPIAANAPQDQIITDPRFPGLEIKIPAGTTIVGWDGVPKNRIAVERLDPDKLPVPAPPIKTKSVYQLYFGTPMGGMPSNKIPVTLPNDLGLEPGRQTALWYYDGSPNEGSTEGGRWKQGGTGTVSADGTVIVTDPGHGIDRFCGVCGLPCFEAAQNEAPYVPCPDCDRNRQQAGKPVNLFTGQELNSAVDLVVDGEVPIVIRRQFNPFDAFAYVANFQQSLGVNWTFGGYDVAMLPFAGDHSLRIVQPGNARADFRRGPDGKFRSSGWSTFDGAEITKFGGTNPTSFGGLPNGHQPPSGAPLNPVCSVDGSVYLLRFRDGREWRFDAAPGATKIRINGGCLYFLSEMRDAQGRFVRITRSDGKIQRVETSSGQFVNFGYTNGVVSSVTDNAGRTVTYNHVLVGSKGGFRAHGATTSGSASGITATESAALAAGLLPIPPFRLVSAVTPEGTYAYTYEDDPPSLRLGGLSFTDSGGGGSGTPEISTQQPTCQNVRGGTRLKTIQLPGVQGVFTNFYGPSKRVLRQTWPDGTEIRFNYKVVGGCVPGLTSSASQPTEGAPIAGGSNTTVCQGAGCVRTDSWDGQAVTGGNVVGVEVTDSRGQKFSQDFNQTGMATKVVDENGQELKLVRDTQNRVTKMTDALGRVTSYEYDSRGNRTRIVDPAGRFTDIAYDATWNKPTSVRRFLADGTPILYQYSYDPGTGVLLTSTDPENNVTNYEYDANKRLARIRDPLTHTTAIEYDAAGNPRKITDALGNSVQMLSDPVGRIIQTSDGLGNDTQAAYNNLNQLTKITDARAGETRFNFDARNKLASVVNPLNNTIESYGYDTIGRLASKTDAKVKSEGYQYDGNGNLTRITDRRGQATDIVYDNANRPMRITYHDGTVQQRTYDAAGRLTEIREPDNAQSLEYDNLDRVIRVVTNTLAGFTTVAYEYDNLDRRTKRSVSYPGGVLEQTTYVYDKASRLTTITQTGVNGTQTTIYAWDAASRLTQKTLPNGIRQQMAYDDANRLLSITYRTTGDTILEQVTYAYDANGQRIVRGSTIGALKDSAFTAIYDEANRMSTITLAASGKTYNLTYDDHGNLSTKQNAATAAETTTYQWDARNRLVGITAADAGGTSTAAFKYDALGRRIEKTITQGVSTQRTQYVYDGIQAVGEFRDGILAATVMTGINIDEVIARTVNVSGGANPVATKSYLTDALGSVLAMTRQDQSPELFYSYSAYGETQPLGADPDSPANSNQYTARENDGLVGGTTGGSLYYYRARYYDPVLKRFIAEDPIGLAGGDPNLYGYVLANPIGNADPLGLAVVDPTGIMSPTFPSGTSGIPSGPVEDPNAAPLPGVSGTCFTLCVAGKVLGGGMVSAAVAGGSSVLQQGGSATGRAIGAIGSVGSAIVSSPPGQVVMVGMTVNVCTKWCVIDPSAPIWNCPSNPNYPQIPPMINPAGPGWGAGRR